MATAYLHYVQGVGLDEVIVICSMDPYVDDEYFAALKELSERATAGTANLIVMGSMNNSGHD